MIERRISELVSVGERLACQLRGEFKIDARKLRDFVARAQGIEAASAAETPKSGSVHESPVANGMMRPMTVEELTTAGREAA